MVKEHFIIIYRCELCGKLHEGVLQEDAVKEFAKQEGYEYIITDMNCIDAENLHIAKLFIQKSYGWPHFNKESHNCCEPRLGVLRLVGVGKRYF